MASHTWKVISNAVDFDNWLFGAENIRKPTAHDGGLLCHKKAKTAQMHQCPFSLLFESGVFGLAHWPLSWPSTQLLLAIVIASFIGIFDECIQAFLPNRVFDPIDILFNVLASVMAVAASAALGWVRRST